MPGATLVDPGITTWEDNVHNWRAADADYLQKRSVMRFATVGNRTTALTATPVAGMVTYNGAAKTLEYTDSDSATANVWRTILAPKYLATSDAVGSFGMRLAGDPTTVVALEAGKVVLGAARVVTVDDTGLKVKTGLATALLTTDATDLVSDKKLKVPGIASSAAVTAPSVAATGAVTAASVTATGALTGASLSVSGSTALGAVTAGAVSASSLASAGNVTGVNLVGSTSAKGGLLTMHSRYLQAAGAGDSYVALDLNAQITGTHIILAPFAGVNPVRFNSTTGPIIPCVVAYASDPGVGSYPEGTIWCQV